MHLELPDGTQIKILIGPPDLVPSAPPAWTGDAVPPAARAMPGSGRPLLKGTIAAAVLIATFALGQHFSTTPRDTRTASAAMAANPSPAPVAEQRGFPDHPVPRDPGQQARTDIPPDFQRQLRQPPTVIPPPGQAAQAGAPVKSPFGLEN